MTHRRPIIALLVSSAVLMAVLVLLIGAGGSVGFNRAEWRHWTDADRDCQDTRQEVLIRDSQKPVLWREDEDEERHCEVAWGQWTDPWSGEILNDPAHMDIDHHVPLAEAHRSGGVAWSASRREAYANDLAYRSHLRATSAHTNRQKGDRGPDRWRPSRREAWCEYALAYSAIKLIWGLSSQEAERLALREMMRTCGDASTPTLLDPPAR